MGPTSVSTVGPNWVDILTGAAAQRWLAETGLYPLNHAVVVRSALVDADPDLPALLAQAFARSRALGLEDHPATVAGEGLVANWPPVSFGLEANRPVLEASVGFAVEQGILPHPVPIEELFAAV